MVEHSDRKTLQDKNSFAETVGKTKLESVQKFRRKKILDKNLLNAVLSNLEVRASENLSEKGTETTHGKPQQSTDKERVSSKYTLTYAKSLYAVEEMKNTVATSKERKPAEMTLNEGAFADSMHHFCVLRFVHIVRVDKFQMTRNMRCFYKSHGGNPNESFMHLPGKGKGTIKSVQHPMHKGFKPTLVSLRQRGNSLARFESQAKFLFDSCTLQTRGFGGKQFRPSTSRNKDEANSLEDLHHAASLLLLSRDRCLNQQSAAK
ncbi:hypothetical protein GUITHDRAFT_117436 [Guillardia theta CCMP2712]|uniref:Uncharacterized protein n=1 Tax=Guillardia theta (strain CCMP2712) TaxID=905079 RepID=L1IJL0_GUITC|nr:hypothetical protein GUITHDRAFT_117436 [Guillardia theta CCMP2712]EKX36438.1 hypothetical protein GUITHDRAFT_117436 [Guillardia theta CCMP2712]|eukprot:XP_005823418.1 hypothetical protein GUITHDRAFT_117436 [Guillardia theta CCMP2712]